MTKNYGLNFVFFSQGLTIEERPLTIELSTKGKQQGIEEGENHVENHVDHSE